MSGTDRRPRVLFLQAATNPVLGADAAVLVDVVRSLDRTAHDVWIACHERVDGTMTPVRAAVDGLDDLRIVPCDLGPEIGAANGWRKVVAGLRSLLAIATIVRLGLRARRWGIDVVHGGDRPRDALAVVLIARICRGASIVHIHQSYSEWWTRLLSRAVHQADVVVPVSEFVAQSLLGGGVRPDRIRTVLNAVDPGEWSPGSDVVRRQARSDLGISADAPLAITVCRLLPWKGVDDAIRAFAGAREVAPDAHLLISGEDTSGGAHAAELEQLVADLGLSESVHFLGRRSDVKELLDAADVFVMPSRFEPFGLVFIEAMAKALPVVALAEGGAVEVVVAGETGLLADPGDVDTLAAHLSSLFDDPSMAAAMGEAGRVRVEANFSLEAQARAVADLYESVRRPRR